MHGSGTIQRDIILGPIEKHQFLSKHLYEVDGEIYAHVDFIRLLTKNAQYAGTNSEIRAFPGLKVLSLYH